MTNTESQGAGEWEEWTLDVQQDPRKRQGEFGLGDYCAINSNRGRVAGGFDRKYIEQIIAEHAAARELSSLRETVGVLEKKAALADELRGKIGFAYVSERAVFEFISRFDALTSPEEVNQHE